MHPRGYVVGSANTVETLTYGVKAVDFSTPPLPPQAAMTMRILQILSERLTASAPGLDRTRE